MSDGSDRLWPQAKKILDQARGLSTAERSAFVRTACAGNDELERAVNGLLAELPTMWRDEDASHGSPPRPLPLDRIGPFRIVGTLGSGGMGEVLLGERDDATFEQRVAIKLLHRDLGSAEARDALVRERQILARLEHPDIARMYDGGVTSTGEPYFVMEFIDGRPIDTYCEAKKLGLSDRVRLVARVCRAVEYAHGRFVVHCDLKPGNILVTSGGDVKLLDFGIAHLVGDDTRGVQREGQGLTPAYAAPEQERGEAVTTATDVFQLGRVLEEVLTGRRRVDLGVPGPDLRSVDEDLDAIVRKAQSPGLADRYPTAEALRRDLEAFLGLRPVAARSPSTSYKLGKYVLRHKWGMAAASAILVTVLAGLIAVAAQSRVVAAERDRARLAESRASAVNDFVLQELLRAPMPETSLGRELTVAEVLGNASRSVGHAFSGAPLVEAEVRLALARTYAALGRGPEALLHAQAAKDLLAHDPAAPRPMKESVERTLAELAEDAGRYGEARDKLEALYASQSSSNDPADPETLRTAAALGRALAGLGEQARAEEILRDALTTAEREHAGLWRLLIEIEGPLAKVMFQRAEVVESERIVRRMLDQIENHVGPDHPERITTLTLLAGTLIGELKYVDAVAVADDAVALSRRVFGPEHPATVEALNVKAIALERLGRYPDALAALREAQAVSLRALGPEHPKTVYILFNLSIMTRHAGDDREAERMMRQVVEARARVLGEANGDTIDAIQALGGMALDRGGEAEARDLALRAKRAFEEAVRPADADPKLVDEFATFLLEAEPASVQDPERALAMATRAVAATGRRLYPLLRTLGDAQARVGKNAEAIATLREALALPDGIRSWSTEERVVELLKAIGASGDVTPFLEERIATQRARPGADLRMIAKSCRLLAIQLQGEGKLSGAERSFDEAAAIFRKVLPPDNWEVGRIASELGGCLAAEREFAKAEPLLLEGQRILKGDRQAKHTSAAAEKRLADLYQAWGRPADAERWRR
jgi:serine/threonine-protein kinase